VDTKLEVVERVEEAVGDADIVLAATSASEPLFDAALLAEGAHLGSAGSHQPHMLEVDPALAACARVFVDDRDAALAEAGELIAAIEHGHTTADDWTLLGDVARGATTGREAPEDKTWFKSVGLAVQDVTAAAAAITTARQKGLGQVIRF
jgi:ornithine cyclodeaminase